MGPTQQSLQTGAPVTVVFQSGRRSLTGFGGLPLLFLLPACIYFSSRGNNKSRCCRFAGGLLGGPGGLSLSSWLRAGKITWEKKKKPSLPFSLFPLDQFSDLAHHQPASAHTGSWWGPSGSRTSPRGWASRGDATPKGSTALPT